jgi:hypothetical protein
VNVPFVLIEAVEAEGLGGSGVVAPALGNVQVADVLDGCDDGGADGGQVGGPRCRSGWRKCLRRMSYPGPSPGAEPGRLSLISAFQQVSGW